MRAPKTFEEGIARLETILAEMQSPDTTLADAVKLYAEAANLVTYCNETLNKTAVQIEEIDARLAQAMPGTTEERGEQ
jgi:exodeoxyribonuclease VII small subunit